MGHYLRLTSLTRLALVVTLATIATACTGLPPTSQTPPSSTPPSSTPPPPPSSSQPVTTADLTKCETWITSGQLMADLPGSTVVVPAPVSDPVVHDGQAATLILCRWAVEGRTHEEEPFFDWMVDVGPNLVLRGNEPDAAWTQRVNQWKEGLECGVVLAGGTPACTGVRENGAQIEVLVLLNNDKFMILHVDTSVTGGRLDYPAQQLKESALRLAETFSTNIRGS